MTDPNQPQYIPPQSPAPTYGAPVAGKTNTLAVVALILGILVPIGGIICGPIALGQIKRTGEGGRGFAIAGIIIGIIFTIVAVLIIVASVIAQAALMNSLNNYSG